MLFRAFAPTNSANQISGSLHEILLQEIMIRPTYNCRIALPD
jgi:hypothetical protein